MTPHDVRTAIAAVPELRVSIATTDEDAMACMRPLASFNQCLLGLVRFSGLTPWERHPAGDELLHVLEGQVDVVVLHEGSGETRATVAAGSVFVVPSGLWHRQHAREGVALFFATPLEGGATSWADDPRE